MRATDFDLAGVSSGVSWLFYLLRPGAVCCADAVVSIRVPWSTWTASE